MTNSYKASTAHLLGLKGVGRLQTVLLERKLVLNFNNLLGYLDRALRVVGIEVVHLSHNCRIVQSLVELA